MRLPSCRLPREPQADRERQRLDDRQDEKRYRASAEMKERRQGVPGREGTERDDERSARCAVT